MDDEFDKEMEDEVYSFIVGSNLEWSLVDQCSDPKLKKKFMKYFQLE